MRGVRIRPLIDPIVAGVERLRRLVDELDSDQVSVEQWRVFDAIAQVFEALVGEIQIQVAELEDALRPVVTQTRDQVTGSPQAQGEPSPPESPAGKKEKRGYL